MSNSSIEDGIVERVLGVSRAHPASKQVVDNRARLSSAIRSYYSDRLHLDLTSEQEAALSLFASKDVAIIKLSHGAMIPHLGVYRLGVKAGEICSMDKDMVSLYVIDDQYYHNWYPEITGLGFYLAGEPPSRQKTALRIPIKKEHKRRPIVEIPPPEEKVLDRLMNQIMGRFGPNLDHFLKLHGLNKWEVDRSLFKEGLDLEFHILKECARLTSSYADFCARYQASTMMRTNPAEAGKVLFLSLWDFKELFRDRFRELFERSDEVSVIKNKVSQEQLEKGGEPLASDEFEPDTPPLWFICSCGRRNRGKRSGQTVRFSCKCGKTTEEEFSAVRFVPDITAMQSVSGSQLRLSGRITGSTAPYAEVADRMQRELFNSEPAPRFVLTSHPTYFGIGEPREGDGRASLLRALCETVPEVLGNALRAPWDEGPQVFSTYLKSQNKSG